MHKNKIVKQLQALPAKELKLLGKYIKNSTYSKKEIVIRLYEFVAKYYPNFEDKKFNKANCFNHLFPELKFKLEQLNGSADEFITKKLKNPFYDLKQLLEDFIIHQELTLDSHEKTILLIKGLFKRQMHEKAFQIIDKELKRLEGIIGDDFYHHFYQFQLWQLKLYNSLNKINLQSNNHEKFLQSLDLFIIHSKLKIGYEVKTRDQLYGEKYNILFFEEAKKTIESNLIDHSNYAVYFYAKICNLENTSSLEDYLKVRNFYFDNLDKFSDKIIRDPLIYLFNYCEKNYKAGNKAFLEEMFELYKFGLDNQLLLQNGYLASSDFKNIVVAATTLSKLDWAKKFISQYAILLPIENRENIALLCSAQIEFSLHNFNKVLSILSNVEFNDVNDNLLARSLTVCAYYNLSEWNALEFFLEAFAKFVKRNTGLSNEVKTSWFNFIKFTKILIQAHFRNVTKKQLLEKLKSYNTIYYETWLTVKVKEFK